MEGTAFYYRQVRRNTAPVPLGQERNRSELPPFPWDTARPSLPWAESSQTRQNLIWKAQPAPPTWEETEAWKKGMCLFKVTGTATQTAGL